MMSLRWLLALGIATSAIGSFGYVFYWSLSAAIVIDGANGFLTTLWELAMMEMAAWVAPGAAAAASFALLMGVSNAGTAIGDYVAAEFVEWGLLSLPGIGALYAVLTMLVVIAVPILPPLLFGSRETKVSASTP
jgi:hypothetical protein